MTFGEKLSKLRKESNYTQEQFAEILGVSRQSVSKWESDIAYPETDKLIRISELFDCSTDYLLKESEDVDQSKEKDKKWDDSYYHIPKERKSKKMLWGMPLWHVGKNAKGVFAVGFNAHGIVAIGLKASGVISLGLLSTGLLSFGVLSIGLFAFGTFALGLLSAGAIAAGILTAGAVCFGIVSFGAASIGEFSVGAMAIGKYIAIGDHAKAMIAIGQSEAKGTLYQVIGDPSIQDISRIEELLDQNVPSYLSWAKKIIKAILN